MKKYILIFAVCLSVIACEQKPKKIDFACGEDGNTLYVVSEYCADIYKDDGVFRCEKNGATYSVSPALQGPLPYLLYKNLGDGEGSLAYCVRI